MIRKFVCPEIVFGFGAINNAAIYAQNLELSKVLIVSDPGVLEAGWITIVTDELVNRGIEFELYTNVTPNPKMEEVMTGAELYKGTGCDGILSIGGGSPMDCAKGVAIVCSNGTHVKSFEGVDKVKIPMPPLICVPTTAGSSADVSQFAIITDTDRHVKMAIISKAVVPDVAIIDPITLTTMDSYLSACTGIDAMVHGIESYVSNAHSCLTEAHSLTAVEKVSKFLLPSIKHPTDESYRNEMMFGSMEAGLAFSNASLGLVHAMAHSLGGFLDLAHGECNALLLEHVIRFNFPEVPDRYRRITEIFHPDFEGDDDECCETLIQSIVKLRESVGITNTLSDCGVKEEHIPRLAQFAYKDACIYTNPRKPTLRDVESIYRAAL